MIEQMAPAAARWRALGTYVFLTTSVPSLIDEARALAVDVLAHVDLSCSRFREDSDLVRANARPGTWVGVDPLLVSAVQVAVEAARVTDGLVDPCLGRTIAFLGYDADMAVVRGRRSSTRRTATPPSRPNAWQEIELDPEGAIRVPVGCALDLGATAKAWASDLVARSIVDLLGCHLVVSLGGDIRVDGPPGPQHPGWPVSITERPDDTEASELVHLSAGGLATSSSTARRWSSGDRLNHHLLDPRTGRPTTEFWRTATATGPTCVAANTATTAALVLGEEAVHWLDERSVSARLVALDGSVTRIGLWPEPVDEKESPTPTTPTKDGRT